MIIAKQRWPIALNKAISIVVRYAKCLSVKNAKPNTCPKKKAPPDVPEEAVRNDVKIKMS